MLSSSIRRRMPRTAAALGAAVLAMMAGRVSAAPAERLIALSDHVPAAVVNARAVSALDSAQPVSLALTLPLRNQAGLDNLLQRLYDKKDPLYGHYLTPDQFAASFGPTVADYDRVVAFAQAQGLKIVGTSSNRAVLDVAGTAAQVQRAFGVRLNVYQSRQDGRYFYAPSSNPVIPASLAGIISGVAGLDNSVLLHPHSRPVAPYNPFVVPGTNSYVLPLTTGSDPSGGLTPQDTKTAYNLNSVPETGSGETLGLFELDGYTPSDITAYETYFGLPNVPLENVLVDGYSGAAGNGAGEVTLDLELQIALAPSVSKIIVYEGPNSTRGVIDTYNKIATENRAKEISTSWGIDEISSGAAARNGENTAFQQMAAQGQSIFAASGDSGAYDDGQSLSVDDPASQPYMVGVGGTDLTTNGPGGRYVSERAWGFTADTRRSSFGAGSGGGISTLWTIPSYQVGVVGSSTSGGSTNMRNVPDVSLYGDYDTGGYAIYLQGGWAVYNGTSAAAPLWSAFTALVNQRRIASGQPTLGFANPLLYQVALNGNYGIDYHDVVGGNNLYFPAVTGYDNASGLGSFNGVRLLADLSVPPTPSTPRSLRAKDGNTQIGLNWGTSAGATTYNLYRSKTSGAETLYQSGLTGSAYNDTAVTIGTTYYYKLTAVNATGESQRSNETNGRAQALTSLLTNSGFENGVANPAPWVATAGVIDTTPSEPAHAGSWKAWLDGYGSAHTDTLSPQVTIPATSNTGTLTFYLHIDTAEKTRTTVYDTLSVQVRDLSGNVLGTVATFSNLDAAAGYTRQSIDLSPYLGQPVRIYLVGKEDSSLETAFVVDDFTLKVQ